ncbi:type II toxin-antitoxin system YhaV family toxin [Terracidiphilus sp.]|jgi:toxin YhaV|uniref:type II toxin-antitoxin system YhaV family toxin n=1 Tax=Terracidiphilus sp. TaxID=1964191 RepID=UPI003C1F1072
MVRNGWKLYSYPLFADQLNLLVEKVEKLAKQSPVTYMSEPTAKLLATIEDLIYKQIPSNPEAPQFRQGNTLGKENKHWFRAKSHQRYRLFFRYSTKHKVIVYAWLNDENTLRKGGARTDPYAVFSSMLKSGNPPQDLDELLARAADLE